MPARSKTCWLNRCSPGAVTVSRSVGGCVQHLGHLDAGDEALSFTVPVDGGAPATPWS
jgi:hypothetical protein